jgi:hypothetical protein
MDEIETAFSIFDVAADDDPTVVSVALRVSRRRAGRVRGRGSRARLVQSLDRPP